MVNEKILVCGAGGFIGGHLISDFLKKGFAVRGVDIKPFNSWYQKFDQVENLILDLRDAGACEKAVEGCDTIYNFSADMGGMGFIEKNKALCMLSVLINTNLLLASQKFNVKKYFYASSACVYNADKQTDFNVTALKEEDAYPAMPEDGYGWEKLFSERMCRHFTEDFGIQTRVARFHNVYGTHGTWDGERAKAPAAICRKVIQAKLSGKHEIEIWGDGSQRRSFMYADDCIKGVNLLMASDFTSPINIGSSELVSVDELVSLVEDIAEIKLKRNYDITAPKGVNGRNSDNTLIKKVLGWEPSISLRSGMEETYKWIYSEIIKNN